MGCKPVHGAQIGKWETLHISPGFGSARCRAQPEDAARAKALGACRAESTPRAEKCLPAITASLAGERSQQAGEVPRRSHKLGCGGEGEKRQLQRRRICEQKVKMINLNVPVMSCNFKAGF